MNDMDLHLSPYAEKYKISFGDRVRHYHPNDPALFPERELPKPGPVVTEDGIEEWSVEKILDSKRAGRGMRYLVRWAGYGVEHDSWEPGLALKDTIALDAWEADHSN